MKCSYTEVFAIASVKTWVVLTLVMHIGKKTTRYELGENISEEGRLVYAPDQREGRDSNGTTERNTLV